MGNRKREDRVQNVDIKRLNHMGLGLKAIADHLGCHPATITLRLKAMNIDPTDTRRSFMEQVFNGLDRDQQDWLSHNLYNAGINVKEFVLTLVREAYEARAQETIAAVPAPMPKLEGGSEDEELTEDIELEEPVATPDELTLGEYEVGGASQKPSPTDLLEPERLVEVSEEPPPVVTLKPRIFG